MAFLSTMNIVGSGMTAQQLRLDVISENITNLNTTRTADGEGPYRRKVTVLQSESDKNGFRAVMARAAGRVFYHRPGSIAEKYADIPDFPYQIVSNRGYETAGGVRVADIIEDDTEEFPLIYDPGNPDANEDGYVQMPNVTLVKEITDAMSASQAFSANVTAFNTLKTVVSKGLEIGTR